jgi:uncharacterized protein (DUF488 family)
MKPVTLYTVGHGNRTADELIALLKAAGITTLVDVRANPASSRHPQFGADALRQALESNGMVYHWAGRQLGGLRRPRPDSPHIALASEGFRGFADHMETDIFQRGVARLISLAMKSRTAMMCAEKLPERCHRSLIADYLVLKGVTVQHIIDTAEMREHQLHPHARTESGRLIYDRQASRPPQLQ